MSLNPRITQWQGKTVWLVGASSGIGLALAHLLHTLGAKVVVSARRGQVLDEFVQNHPGSLALSVDVINAHAMQMAAQQAQVFAPDGKLHLVVYCAAYYRPMRATQFDLDQALQHQRVNVEGALNCLHAVLPLLLQQGQGHLSLMASVAGYRGLPQSLAYGPTKAALINLAESLYLDLSPLGLGVSVVNPGFVNTPLTAQNDFAMPALLTPEKAAQAMVHGWSRGRFEIHFPWRFTMWLKLMRILPYGLFFAAVSRITRT
jgi:NAD(P)-dependent dehydrogenase (short-subunit alcohol dehydrogenase family)